MEMIPANIFSGDDLQILLPRLWELLRKQTERYTSKDSTSVTIETAQELLASLWYTITLALDETHIPYGRLLSDELMPFVKQQRHACKWHFFEKAGCRPNKTGH